MLAHALFFQQVLATGLCVDCFRSPLHGDCAGASASWEGGGAHGLQMQSSDKPWQLLFAGLVIADVCSLSGS